MAAILSWPQCDNAAYKSLVMMHYDTNQYFERRRIMNMMIQIMEIYKR